MLSPHVPENPWGNGRPIKIPSRSRQFSINQKTNLNDFLNQFSLPHMLRGLGVTMALPWMESLRVWGDARRGAGQLTRRHFPYGDRVGRLRFSPA